MSTATMNSPTKANEQNTHPILTVLCLTGLALGFIASITGALLAAPPRGGKAINPSLGIPVACAGVLLFVVSGALGLAIVCFEDEIKELNKKVQTQAKEIEKLQGKKSGPSPAVNNAARIALKEELAKLLMARQRAREEILTQNLEEHLLTTKLEDVETLYADRINETYAKL